MREEIAIPDQIWRSGSYVPCRTIFQALDLAVTQIARDTGTDVASWDNVETIGGFDCGLTFRVIYNGADDDGTVAARFQVVITCDEGDGSSGSVDVLGWMYHSSLIVYDPV